jgi:hypothetical protein
MLDTDIELIAVPKAAEALEVPARRVDQWIRDGVLVSIADAGGVRCVPAAFILDGAVVKGLQGVITLLRDANYADDEIVTWLFRSDDSLPGTPIQALRENRGTEVKRRAQVAGYSAVPTHPVLFLDFGSNRDQNSKIITGGGGDRRCST